MAITSILSSAVGAEPVTAVYQDKVGGYRGTRDVWIREADAVSQAGGATHVYVGRYKNQEWKALVKFTGLGIPAGSEIKSVRLSLNITEISGRPRIGVYGLLKDFTEDPSPEPVHPAAKGITTWNQVRKGEESWSQPGAAKASDRLEYDGDGDFYAQPAPFKEIHGGSMTWDVTETFVSQFENGKEYGWLLVETTGTRNRGTERFGVRFDTRELELAPLLDDWVMSSHATGADWPAIRFPRLTVSYIPPDPNHRPRGKESPKLICFRIEEAGEMSRDLDRVRRMPFDGAVFLGMDNAGQDGKGGRALSNRVMGPDILQYDDYTELIAAMQRIHGAGSTLTDNFLRINAVPGTMEPVEGGYHWENRARYNEKVPFWWDEHFDTVVNNWRLAARIAKEAGMKGIFYDGESYAGNIYNYASLKDAEALGKSLEETKVQVRKRGREIAGAIREEFPDMTMPVIYYVYSGEASDLWNVFWDGMLEGSDRRTRFISGNELYRLSSADQFWRAYRYGYDECVKLSAVPDRYLEQVHVGFGVWFNRNHWSEDPELNNYSSAAWQTKLENAMKIADSYVWVFTGGDGGITPNWWTGEHIPDAYYEATRRASELARRRWRAE